MFSLGCLQRKELYMDNSQDKRFALLIDGDNISSQYIKTIVDEITNFGIVTYKRIYGDWTKPQLNGWKKILLDYSITPMQQYSYTTGKNSTDSAMIIDAMDILYAGTVDGFCLASSDSDFTKLAVRLREAGMVVVGMGNEQTPRPFVTACSQFKYIDLIGEEVGTASEPQEAKASAKKSTKNTPSTTPKETNTLDCGATKDVEIKDYVRKCIKEHSEEDGYMLMSGLGSLLQKKYPDFDPRNFGKKKLSELLKAWKFEIKAVQDPNNQKNPSGLILYVK
jgi:uncharacterized LabA/DUF88 family protein